jgi:hypothetical protein
MKQFTARFSSGNSPISEQHFSLSPGESILVGNTKGRAGLQVDADSVSRKHLYIALDGNSAILVCDAGSSNGTFISGNLLPENQWHRLRPLETVSLGREIRMQVIDSSNIESIPPIPPADPDRTRLEANEHVIIRNIYVEADSGIDRGRSSAEDKITREDLEQLVEIASSNSQSNNSKSVDWFSETLGSLLVLALVVCAALTNPTKQDHLKALSDRNEFEGAIVLLANDLGAVKYKSFVVFSLLEIEGKVVTIGFFKNVVFNEGKTQKSNQGP